jgi:FtsP/CotA-like multicopper oxidase with cupredoxin domain
MAERPDQRRIVSRRGFLAAGVGLGTTLLGSRWVSGQGHEGHGRAAQAPGGAATASTTASGGPLIEPEVRRSVDGELHTTLRARYAYKQIGDYQLHVRTYEGVSPGPTLRCRPGDTLRIRLINDLPPNRDETPVKSYHPHNFNTTNFHFHGSHVSPGGIADNVFRSMLPGQGYDVEIAIPKDHTRGTYWYHPHHHGGADIQMASGMSGVIILEGDFDAVPEIAQARERTLVLGQVVFDSFRTVEDFGVLFPETATRFFSLNGQRMPVIDMRPGEVQRWRLLHAGYQDVVRIVLERHAMHAIAHDGIALPRLDRRDELIVAPGQRADLLVQAGAAGTYLLAALPHSTGYPAPEGPIARVVVAGEPKPMNLPMALPPVPLAGIRDAEITGTRTITFSAKGPENDAAGHWQEFTFLVDGRLFDHNRVDQRVRLGAVEEWTINNLHVHGHVFHIHTNPFQVTKINGQVQADPVWRDTAIVPRLGSLTFRTRFLDYPGKFVFHCHMMNHEELGMMQTVEVVEAR